MLPFGVGQGYANSQNLELQKEQFAYQQDIQRQLFAREDDAVQRRAADLTAAGMSPTLAAGQAAQAGPVVSTTVPQRGPSPDIAGQVMNLMSAQAGISKTAQETNTSAAQSSKLHSDNLLTQLTTAEKAYNLDYYRKKGLPTNASGLSKDAVQLFGVIDSLTEKLKNRAGDAPIFSPNIKKLLEGNEQILGGMHDSINMDEAQKAQLQKLKGGK